MYNLMQDSKLQKLFILIVQMLIINCGSVLKSQGKTT